MKNWVINFIELELQGIDSPPQKKLAVILESVILNITRV
jgi:hypothetical protein